MSGATLKRSSAGMYRAHHAGKWAEVSQRHPKALWVTVYCLDGSKAIFGPAFNKFADAKRHALSMIR